MSEKIPTNDEIKEQCENLARLLSHSEPAMVDIALRAARRLHEQLSVVLSK